MTFNHSKADPCLFFKWTVHGLVLWVTWVDDCLVCGKKEGVLVAKKQLMDRFDCNEISKLMEYIECKIDRGDGWMKLTQPVLLQSFEDEFDLLEVKTLNTPAAPREVLCSGTEKHVEQGDADQVQVWHRKAFTFDEVVEAQCA